MDINLDFRLRQGDFALEVHERVAAQALALFGPSGAGKTTILDAIAGLRRPEAGDIRIGSHVLYSSTERVNLPPRLRRIGYVPQDIALFPHMNARRNILYGAARGARVEIDRVLRILEIGRLLDRPVARLSGGERQRVAIARALMSSPDLLLLDEPLTAVDVALRQRILPYLKRVRDELAIPLLYVAHDATEVTYMADWMLVLDAGRIVRSAPADEALRTLLPQP